MSKQTRILLVTVVLPLLLCQGCYHFRIVTDENPGTEYRKKTIHNIAWGLLVTDAVAENCVGDNRGNGLDEVRVSTNLGYSLVTIITLGFWAPLEVEWRCIKPPNDDDDDIFGDSGLNSRDP